MTNWNFTDISQNTKKAERFINKYNRSDCYRIEDAYKRPSHTKIAIYESLIRGMNDLNGFYMRITCTNSSFFCCAFRYDDNCKHYLVYITPMHNYRILINE